MQTASGPDPPASGPVSIPDHTLLRCIGRGSYGEVWLARSMMGVYRAVKIVHRKSFHDERPFERELSGIRKFEPISRSHEGFVDVLQVGINEPEGYFYYVMELGDDQTSGQRIDPENYSPKTLAKELAERPALAATALSQSAERKQGLGAPRSELTGRLTFQECLELGIALSQSLAELHKHELVHRDVKPSNIIFVNGVPKLADIGLVAEFSEARSYVGTEGFIPPEGPGTPQADVYGLGKVLYEASTGKDRQEFPELPTQFEKFPDHDAFLELNEVIVHACRNDLSGRYPSAWEMHADLLVLANGKSVRRLKLLERRLSRLKRAAGIATIIAIILAAIGYEVYRERRAIVESRQRQVGANVAYGNRAMETGDLLGALPFFAEALRQDNGNARQETDHRLRLGSILAQCPKLTRLWFAGKQVEQAQFSPDGKLVLIAKYFDKVEIRDLQTGSLYGRSFGQPNGLVSATFSPDGRLVVTASEDGTACIWDLADLDHPIVLPHPQQVLSARFNSAGDRVITACHDGVARIWNVRTHQVESSLPEAAGAQKLKGLRFADFSHNGRFVVTAGEDNTARIWDPSSRRVCAVLEHPGQNGWVNYAAFSPDDQQIVTASTDQKARAWEIGSEATGARRIMPDLAHADGVTSVQFSADGRLIITASLDGTARLWLADNLQPVASNPVLPHGERVTHAAFNADTRLIVTACVDGSVRIWDRAGATPALVPHAVSRNGMRFLTATNNRIEVRDTISGNAVSAPISLPASADNAQLNQNGLFLTTSSVLQSNHVTQVWEVSTGQLRGTIPSLDSPAAAFALSDDGAHLLTFDKRSALCWDVQSGTSVPLRWEGNQPLGSAFFSPDGSRIAIRSGKQIQIFDAVTGQSCFTPLEHSAQVQYAGFSPDGSQMVGCSSDQQYTKCYAQIWRLTGDPAKRAGPRLKHRDGVSFASFSPDGARVVTASEDFTALVWDADSGRQLTRPLKHANWVRMATFSPDGKWVLTASSDKTARVWNAENGDPLTPPLRHLSELVAARFLSDGRSVVTIGTQRNTWRWNLRIEDKPVDDLVMLGCLLSASSTAPVSQQEPPQSEHLEAISTRLRTQYPHDCAASSEEIAAWHEFQANESEMQHQWFATAFHLERLLAGKADPALADRLARAKERLRVK